MDHLPDEAGIRIVSFIQARNDLKSVRLTNKKYSPFATKELFRTVIVHFRRESLQKLLAISKQPSLYSLVTDIVYEADGDVRNYWTSAHPSQTESASLPVDNEEYLGIAFDESTRLASSMTNLPNINNVRFQNLDSQYQNLPAPSDPTEDLWIMPRCLRGHGVRSFFAMMRAASVTLSNLKYLEVSEMFHGIHYDFLDLIERPDMQHTNGVFQDLIRIFIYIDTKEGESESQRVLAKGFLGKLLTASTRLEDLSVGFDQRPDTGVRFVDVIGPGTWSALRTFRITGLNFHLVEVTEFLERHPDITHIGLSNCKLYSSTFKQLLESLRDDLDLQTVTLDGSLGDQDAEYDFLESSQNRESGIQFVLGHIDYPVFQPESVNGNGVGYQAGP